LIEALRSNSSDSVEHCDKMKDYTCRLFEHALFGSDSYGRLIVNGMEERHIVSLGKSLTDFRIYKREVHDKYYEIAFKIMPKDPINYERYIHSLLHYSSHSSHKHNYEKVIAFMI
jgi:hypothetical protein